MLLVALCSWLCLLHHLFAVVVVGSEGFSRFSMQPVRTFTASEILAFHVISVKNSFFVYENGLNQFNPFFVTLPEILIMGSENALGNA